MSKIEWSGKTSSYHHKWNNTPNPPDTKCGVRKVWLLDAQWSTCPVEVEDEVKILWREYGLGNDNYMIRTSIQQLEDYSEETTDTEYHDKVTSTTAIRQYLEEMGVGFEDEVIIHWWW